jgi:hypothetical protein
MLDQSSGGTINSSSQLAAALLVDGLDHLQVFALPHSTAADHRRKQQSMAPLVASLYWSEGVQSWL